VAQSAGWSTGTVAKAEPVSDQFASAPQWSVVTYRRQLAGAQSDPNPDMRASLGGPQRSRLVIGPLGSLAEAERMRHEVEEIGPVAIEPAGSGPEPAYRVVVGPLDGGAIEAAQEMAGFAGGEGR
jgi:hypothetical protein